MDLGIAGRTAFVAASTAGLGRAVATALAHEGAHVVVTGRRADAAAALAATLPSAIGIGMDVTDAASREQALRRAGEAFGPVDILIGNGPGPAPGTAAGMTGDELDATFRTLVMPTHDLIARTLPHMRAQGWGRIVAIGSSSIQAPLAGLAASNTGRVALAGYLKTLAAEVAADGVTVNLVLPGRIATDRVAHLDAARAQREHTTADEVARLSARTIPAGRYGTPEEFAAAVAFLAGAPASYITGVALRCDGGLVPVL